MTNPADISSEMEELEAGGRKSKKERGYAQLEGASSEEDLLVSASSKSWKPKSGKTKVFGKHKEKEKKEKTHKSKGREKDASPDSKGTRSPKPKSPSPGHREVLGCVEDLPLWPIVGVELGTGVERNPSHDGVPIPAAVRRAIDVVSNHGLKEEGVYRVSAAKSKVDAIRDSVDRRGELGRLEAGPEGVHAAAGFLKLYLRSLPSHLLTEELHPHFEKAAKECPCRGESAYCRCLAGDRVAALLRRLPPANYFLTAYVFLHFRQVIKHERYNKMNLVSIGLIIEPMLRISQRLLALLLRNAHADYKQATTLFKDTKLKRYVAPLRPPPERLTSYLPTQREAIAEELGKQQSLLRHLHWALDELRTRGRSDAAREQELWEVQMVETQLKRRLKSAAPGTPTAEPEGPCLQLFEEKQLLAAQMELKTAIAAEKSRIAALCAAIREAEAGGARPPTPVEETPEEQRHWKEELVKEQRRHDGLLRETIEERGRCARLRAEIELIAIQREKRPATKR